MSTDEPKRRLEPSDVFQASGLLFVTAGAWTVNTAAGLITAGIACLWIGWSTS